MAVSASELRANIYRILDRVLATGVPIEVVRGHRKLKIVPDDSGERSKLDAIRPRPEVLLVDPDALVHVDWSKEWRP
jgi:antitoxin (DNA-binding transcriptional repressor) of toxin-antitoxin stability system